MNQTAYEIQLRELKDTISQLNNTITSQNQMIATLQETVSNSQAREANLLEQIDYLTKKLFGKSSEHRDSSIDGQFSLFDEVESEFDETLIELKEETNVKAHTRKSKTLLKDKIKNLETIKEYLPIDEADTVCPHCNTPMEVLGEEYVRTEYKFIPAKLLAIEYYSQTYSCPQCKEDDEPFFTKSKSYATKALMPHSPASPSTVAWAMYQKYANGIPLYRQEKDWSQYGADISRTTLANWITYTSNRYLNPLYDFFHRKLIERKFLMADETTVQVLKELDKRPESKSYMWLYRTGEDGLPPIILYGYSSTRAGENAKEFLKGFKGYLTCDGYQGYNKVDDVTRCCCWAHVRRYFIDAIPKGKQYDYANPAVQGVQFCDRLFRYEDSYKKKNYSYEKRYEMRLEQEKPVLDAFWSWFDNLRPVRNSRLDKAVTYINNRREFLMTYLEDGRCSFTNNLSENAIRPFTVGRKNWLFSDSVKGVNASATVYTIVEMAKAHSLNIYKYLEYVLEHRPSSEMSDDDLEQLAPWSALVQEKCKN